MLGEMIGTNCMMLGFFGPRDTLMNLNNCYPKDSDGTKLNFDEHTLHRMEDFMAKAKREFETSINDFVQGWNVQNWSRGKT